MSEFLDTSKLKFAAEKSTATRSTTFAERFRRVGRCPTISALEDQAKLTLVGLTGAGSSVASQCAMYRTGAWTSRTDWTQNTLSWSVWAETVIARLSRDRFGNFATGTSNHFDLTIFSNQERSGDAVAPPESGLLTGINGLANWDSVTFSHRRVEN